MRNMESSSKKGPFVSNLFMMRHGERMDNYDPEWIRLAQRPWDPPLATAGKIDVLSLKLFPGFLGNMTEVTTNQSFGCKS